MSGNVFQYCYDGYNSSYYKNSLGKDPIGPKNGDDRVIRGGAWNSEISFIRSAARKRKSITPNSSTGFRIAQSIN
jgi:formylglycine-generating enzyme required for sulfatase activity